MNTEGLVWLNMIAGNPQRRLEVAKEMTDMILRCTNLGWRTVMLTADRKVYMDKGYAPVTCRVGLRKWRLMDFPDDITRRTSLGSFA